MRGFFSSERVGLQSSVILLLSSDPTLTLSCAVYVYNPSWLHGLNEYFAVIGEFMVWNGKWHILHFFVRFDTFYFRDGYFQSYDWIIVKEVLAK